MTYSVIIPSCDNHKVLDCVASLIETHRNIKPEQIIIVSDGLLMRTRWALRGVTWVRGKKPFVFPRAINMGVRAAPKDSDIVILGDDVRFTAENSIDLLRMEANECDAAVVGPEVWGLCGQSAQRPNSNRDSADWLAFICVYIPRAAWENVGELDELFVGYGYDDVDWCLRAKDYGPIRVEHSVRVIHIDDSSYRTDPIWLKRYEENRVRFNEKWGHA